MQTYYRPLVMSGVDRSDGAIPLAGRSDLWWDRAERIQRGMAPEIVMVQDIPSVQVHAISAPRPAVRGCPMTRAAVMGIVNVTPDSFSDGGQFDGAAAAVQHALALRDQGADLLDVGGESTRPGAQEVPIDEEITRVAPVVSGIMAAVPDAVISVDTRKSAVAQAALQAGGLVINDVSAGLFDPAIIALAAQSNAPICVMHAQGRPETMQDDPRYENVVLDVYDHLADRIQTLIAAGVPKAHIIVDPGIGFGKTQSHNLRLLRDIAIFHGLGVPILLGASRKRFIGAISGVEEAAQRVPGSLAVALGAAAQGVQILRVHDVAETVQALALQQAVSAGA